MLIRKAREVELPEIIKLSRLWEQEQITFGLRANSIDDIRLLIDEYFWIALDEDQVIGYIYGSVKNNDGISVLDQNDKQYLEIEEIYVHPAHRTKGIGRNLMNNLINDINNNDIRRVTVSSANKDWKSIKEFYEKFGFKMWTLTMYK